MELFSTNDSGQLYAAVLELAGAFKARGGRALVVGGAVRDALLHLPVKDFDLEVHGLPAEQVRRIVGERFEFEAVGMSFGVLKLRRLELDVSLPRRESKTGAGHRGFLIEETPDLSFAEAAARRDYTVNAIMYDPLNGELIDPHHGAEDLRRRILRHVSAHFVEDPLRVLRGMQFAARLEFSVAPETAELCATLDQRELAVERIGAEWEKMLLRGVKPSAGLEFLRRCRWVHYYPELAALIGVPQHSGHHPEGDVWNHTQLVLDAAAAFRSGDREHDLMLMGAALAHDFGKPATLRITPEKISSPGHAVAGALPARAFFARLWHRPELVERIVALVECHMRPGDLVWKNAPDGEFRRLALKTGPLRRCYELFAADVGGCAAAPERLTKLLAVGETFRRRAEELGVWESVPVPLLQGRHLIERGLQPGPEFARRLKQCFEAQIDGAFNDLAGALDYLEQSLRKEKS